MRKLSKIAAAVSLAMGVAAGPALAEDPLKVGFLYVGPVSDFGYSYQHDQARQYLEKEFGDKIETTYIENVTEPADAERAIERLARSGHELIFTTSFGFMNPTLKVAKRFPDVKFEHATGYKRAKNVSTYSARFYEARYVMGQIAASESKTGVAGYVAAFPIPEVVRGMNSFMLGAQSVNPDFKIKIIWANSWYDPGREADAAKALIDQGADVIVQHTDSPAPLQIAQERGVLTFGQASDMIKFAPEAQASALVNDWKSYYKNRVEAVMNDTWESSDTWGGFKAEMVRMAPYANVSEETIKLANETVAKLEAGEFHPFTGPVMKQDGSEWLKEGETADDGTLLGMNFYVKGFTDSLPN
ncbi:BMP family ABC transporter substrate-binding protein [Rhodobacteraceae bacterium RKSG542]|uniref:BMP family ABC transporter substrate-binding protein n=1 Tax=Pseudovibrio flavus TaxID=2529854 RepID=UPI0012BB8B13|nr:BMP family ABC transporter substrate-binding protein [Pseudovibrio flavus]MTI17535.1 BMP family ABC transporter substrate-binding protein [Pseudovibrio flavus]